MTPHEAEDKRRLIAALTPGEIEGWKWALAQKYRPPFEGELAALAERAKKLGVGLNGRKSQPKWKGE